MIFRKTFVSLLALVLVAQSSAFAAAAPVELRWSELNALIFGKKVQLVLPGGANVEGTVAAIREDALVLDVSKTSDKKAQPKGNAVIPRSSVTLLQLEQKRGGRRTIGTVLGVLGGVVLGGYVAAKTANSGGAGIAVFLGVAAAGSLAGWAAGGAADHKTTMIRVLQ